MRQYFASAILSAAVLHGPSSLAQANDENSDASLLNSVDTCIVALEDSRIESSDFEPRDWMTVFFGVDEKRLIQRGIFLDLPLGGIIITQANLDGTKPVCSTFTTRDDVTHDQVLTSLSRRFDQPKIVENRTIWKDGDLAIVLGRNDAGDLAVAVLASGEQSQ